MLWNWVVSNWYIHICRCVIITCVLLVFASSERAGQCHRCGELDLDNILISVSDDPFCSLSGGAFGCQIAN